MTGMLHGHFCPFLALGVRAALRAVKELGTSSTIQFVGGLGTVGLANSGFNNAGQVAFKIFAGAGEAIVIGGQGEATVFAVSNDIDVQPGSMTVSWPEEFPDTVVESTIRISDRESWEPAGVTPVLENNRYRATIPTTATRGFIRLRRSAAS